VYVYKHISVHISKTFLIMSPNTSWCFVFFFAKLVFLELILEVSFVQGHGSPEYVQSIQDG